MKAILARPTLLLALIVGAAFTPAAPGQQIVSTMPGYIHFAEGGVLLEEQPFEFNVAQVVHLGNGQRLRTVDGRAEVMIAPGSFIRIAPQSELELVRVAMSTAHLRLIRGSAAIDLARAKDTKGITVEIGDARIRFMKAGLYRLDIPAGANPAVRVRRGKATVELRSEKIELGGKWQLTIAPLGEELRAQKIGRLAEDELDRWNAERRDLLAAESRKQNRASDNGLVPPEDSPLYDCQISAARCPPARDPMKRPRPPRPPGALGLPFARLLDYSP